MHQLGRSNKECLFGIGPQSVDMIDQLDLDSLFFLISL